MAAETIGGSVAPNRRSIPLLAAAAAGAALISIVLLMIHFDFPPLVDWPNHMARHYLEALWLTGQPLPPGYEIHYSLMPNLGSDLIVPFLIPIFGPVLASKIFLLLAIGVYWLGPTLFVLQQGNSSSSAYGAAALLLPWLLAGTFFWGFLNYYSGVGLAFAATVNHIRLANMERQPAWQLLLHAALVVLLYLWHLTSIGIYLVLAGCHGLVRLRESGWRLAALTRLLPLYLTLVPAALTVAHVMLTPKLNALSGGAVWSTPLRKLTLVAAYFVAYTPWLDMALLAMWCAAIFLIFKIARPKFSTMMLPALAAAAFGTLYLALPVEIGTTSGADIRMLPPLLITLVAMLATFPLAPLAPLGLSIIAAVAVMRPASIAHAWSGMDEDAHALIGHFAKARPNARILVLTLDRATKQQFQSHLMGWAVLQNGAYVTDLFAYAGQQTLSLKGPDADQFMAKGEGGYQLDVNRIAQNFDYVWIFNPAAAAMTLPPSWHQVLGQGAGRLWQVQ